jgi:hypothetical protein
MTGWGLDGVTACGWRLGRPAWALRAHAAAGLGLAGTQQLPGAEHLSALMTAQPAVRRLARQ